MTVFSLEIWYCFIGMQCLFTGKVTVCGHLLIAYGCRLVEKYIMRIRRDKGERGSGKYGCDYREEGGAILITHFCCQSAKTSFSLTEFYDQSSLAGPNFGDA